MSIEQTPTTNGKCNVFVYGKLCLPHVQKDVLGRVYRCEGISLPGFVALDSVLEGYRKLQVAHNPNTATGGFLLHVSDEELARIDAFEGQRRKEMELSRGRKAWVYEMSRA